LTFRDIERAYDWVCEKVVKVPEEELIIYGQSIGSGPSIHLASTLPVAALILHSAITSGLRVLTNNRWELSLNIVILWWGCRCLATFDIFPNIERIPHVSCPTLIIHGREDREVPYHHGMDLYNALSAEYKR